MIKPYHAAVLLALFALMLFTALQNPPTTHDGKDSAVMLNAGYRVAIGQIPHTDYSSAQGPVQQYMIGAIMAVFGKDNRAMAIYSGLMILLFGSIALWFVRTGPADSIAFTAIVALTAGGLWAFGMPAERIAFTLTYNRLGWACFLLVAYMCLFRRTSNSIENLVVGIIAALAVFSKASFGLMCISAIIFSFYYQPKLERCLAILSGFAMVLIAIVLHGVDLSLFMQDMAIASKVRNASLWWPEKHWFQLYHSGWMYAIAIALLWRIKRRLAIGIWFGLALSIGNAFTCGDDGFNPYLLLVILATTKLACKPIAYALIIGTLGLATIGSGVNALLLKDNPELTLENMKWQVNTTHSILDMTGGAKDFIDLAKDLVQEHGVDSVLVLDYIDMVSMELRLTPMGGALWNHHSRSFDENNYIEHKRYFRGVKFVLFPTIGMKRNNLIKIVETYGDYMKMKNFKLVGENEAWQLYRKP